MEKEEVVQELLGFWERIGDIQENIDFTEDENDVLEETAFYVKKAAIFLDLKQSASDKQLIEAEES